jgi:oligopeptide transport system substrate-binding protein
VSSPGDPSPFVLFFPNAPLILHTAVFERTATRIGLNSIGVHKQLKLINKARACIVGTVLTVFVAGLTGCTDRRATSDELRRGLGGEPSTLDPERAADWYSFEVLRDLFEGLTAETATGEVAPGVAEDWSVSPDGLRYSFRIRSSARWSNGESVTAADFADGLRRAVDPRTAAPGADLLALIRNAPEILSGKLSPSALGVQTVDRDVLLIELRQPAPYFLGVLANSVAYPVHRPSLAEQGNEFTKPGRLISNGAYRLAGMVPGSEVTLERNPYYWDAAHVSIRTVKYAPITDLQAELLRYRAGALDMTSSLPTAEFEWAKTNLGTELQVRPQLSVIFLCFSATSGPFRDHSTLGEALSLALNREAVTDKVLRAGQVAAYSFVPPGMSGYTPQNYAWSEVSQDARLTKARDLYRAAGYSSTRPLHVRMLFNQNEAIRNVAIASAAQWKEALGVEVELVDMEFRAFLAARHDRTRWDVVIDGWNADYADPGNFLELFRTGGVQNDPGLADPEFDGLLDAAANEPSPERRLTLLASAEKRLLADGVVAPVYFPVTRRLVKPYVDGAILNPMNHNYSKYLRLLPRPMPTS